MTDGQKLLNLLTDLGFFKKSEGNREEGDVEYTIDINYGELLSTRTLRALLYELGATDIEIFNWEEDNERKMTLSIYFKVKR